MRKHEKFRGKSRRDITVFFHRSDLHVLPKLLDCQIVPGLFETVEHGFFTSWAHRSCTSVELFP